MRKMEANIIIIRLLNANAQQFHHSVQRPQENYHSRDGMLWDSCLFLAIIHVWFWSLVFCREYVQKLMASICCHSCCGIWLCWWIWAIKRWHMFSFERIGIHFKSTNFSFSWLFAHELKHTDSKCCLDKWVDEWRWYFDLSAHHKAEMHLPP